MVDDDDFRSAVESFLQTAFFLVILCFLRTLAERPDQ